MLDTINERFLLCIPTLFLFKRCKKVESLFDKNSKLELEETRFRLKERYGAMFD